MAFLPSSLPLPFLLVLLLPSCSLCSPLLPFLPFSVSSSLPLPLLLVPLLPSPSTALCSEEYSCSMQGDALIQTIPGVDNEELCHSLCVAKGDCQFYTYYDYSSSSLPKFCFLFSRCDDPEECEGCHTGPLDCPTVPTTLLPTTPQPEDCEYLEEHPPPHGKLDCYTTEGGRECHLLCELGYATKGPSTVKCRDGLGETVLACQPSFLLITGGKKSLEYVELYSTSTNSCRVSLPPLPSLYEDHSLDYVDGRLLLCGGFTSSQSCLTLLPNQTWIPHSNLTAKRAHHSSAVYRNWLHLIGGYDSSTETWKAGEAWKPSFPLPEEVSVDGCAAPISSTEVVLSGGHKCSKCAHIYNLETGEVERTGDMKDGRSSHGCTSYMDPEGGGIRVLVAGGWHSKDVATAEVYNPVSGRWRVVGDLKAPRRGLTLATIEGGTVVAIGGHHTTDSAVVDTYDTLLEVWQEAPIMKRQRSYHAATPVPSSMFSCL